jgi:hypothetical protein
MNNVLSKAHKEGIATARTVRIDSRAATTGPAMISQIPSAKRGLLRQKKIENAVFGYIQAVRALGRTTINTTEVARALDLNLADVERTLSALRRRGVKTPK